MTRQEYLQKQEELWKVLGDFENTNELDFELVEEYMKEIFVKGPAGIDEKASEIVFSEDD